MKLTTKREELVSKLSIVSRAVSTRAATQALSGVLLTAADGRVTLSATDLDLGLETTLAAEVAVKAGRVDQRVREHAGRQLAAQTRGALRVEPDVALVVVIDKSGSMDACHCNSFGNGIGGGSGIGGGQKGDHGQGGAIRAAAPPAAGPRHARCLGRRRAGGGAARRRGARASGALRLERGARRLPGHAVDRPGRARAARRGDGARRWLLHQQSAGHGAIRRGPRPGPGRRSAPGRPAPR